MSQVSGQAVFDQLRQLDESDRIEAKRASAISESRTNEPGDLSPDLLQECDSLSRESEPLSQKYGALSQESVGETALRTRHDRVPLDTSLADFGVREKMT